MILLLAIHIFFIPQTDGSTLVFRILFFFYKLFLFFKCLSRLLLQHFLGIICSFTYTFGRFLCCGKCCFILTLDFFEASKYQNLVRSQRWYTCGKLISYGAQNYG